jgi:hypothetical protein
MEFANADPSVIRSIRQRGLAADALRQQRRRHADRRLFKSISIDGGFKISNLMGLRPNSEPVILTRAIINRAFVPTPANAHSSGEVIELDYALRPGDFDATSFA